MENQGPPRAAAVSAAIGGSSSSRTAAAAADEHACAGAGAAAAAVADVLELPAAGDDVVGAGASDFKNHQLPLARIKKIMKADEDVRMISAEAPVLFAKACELFILELTIRSWLHAEENKRRTLQRNDIAAAITRTDVFDFLVDIVPRPGPDDPPPKDDADAAAAAAAAASHALSPVGFVAPDWQQQQHQGGARTAQGWPPVWPPGAAEDGGYGRGQGVYVGHSPTNTTTSAATPPPGS
uniref:Core Histone H2A/H2B/H3 domain-containing protein n=1 Tax=Ananas comosus var. bracteatus TaxID=296719 RepID=A0A6V7NPI3_ANACO|nr:unnamed protein product [Ananas comosus var. bracteatus]